MALAIQLLQEIRSWVIGVKRFCINRLLTKYAKRIFLKNKAAHECYTLFCVCFKAPLSVYT